MPEKLSPDAVQQAPDVTLADVFNEMALLQELAELSPLAYDRRREEAAKQLGVRVSALDAEVAARRSCQAEEGGNGTPVLFTDPEPWADPVDGTELLSDLVETVTRHAVLPDGGAEALALWVLHTYAHEAAQVSPILCMTSPQKRCGKTTVLSVLRGVVSRPLPTANVTAAALFRATELWRPMLLVDEADNFLRDNKELRGVLNSGHVRDMAHVVRTVEDAHEPRAFCTWAPKAVALIGKLPDTLAERAIVLPMRRKLPSEKVERLRLDRLNGFEDLRRRCVRWAEDHLEAFEAADPAMPEKLHDRASRQLAPPFRYCRGGWW